MAWTPEKVQDYHAGHLYEAADWIERQHPRWPDHFGRQVSELQGLGWMGKHFDSALAQEQGFKVTAQGMAEHASLAAQEMRMAAGAVDSAKSAAWNAIATAQEDDFEVDLDKGVRDKLPPDPLTVEARQAAATAHAASIATTMQAFKGSLSAAATLAQGHAATQRGITMTDFKADKGPPPVSPDPNSHNDKKHECTFGEQFQGFAEVAGGSMVAAGGGILTAAGGSTEALTGGTSSPISIPGILAGVGMIAQGSGSVEKGLDALHDCK